MGWKWEDRKKNGAPTGEKRLVAWRTNPHTGETEKILQSSIPKRILKSTDEREIQKYFDEEDAKIATAKSRAKQRLESLSKYHDFSSELSKFEVFMSGKSPKDGKNSVRDLSHWVFHFFLNIKSEPNINKWPPLYLDFRQWLETDAVGIKSKKKISYSQMNSVISALNNFLEMKIQRHEIDLSVAKCRRFEQSKIKRRGIESVADMSEQQALKKVLDELDPAVSAVVQISFAIGGRRSEILGLSLANVFDLPEDGKVPDKDLQQMLELHKIRCFGYVAFNSQLVNASKPRLPNGKVERCALKHRDKIDHETFRIVPITDLKNWRLLVELHEKASESYSQKEFGENFEDYLLFNIPHSRVAKALKAAYKRLPQYTRKTLHDCRHTFTTELAGKAAADHRIFQITLGHQDQDTTAKYNHLYNAVSRNIAAKSVIKAGGLKKFDETD